MLMASPMQSRMAIAVLLSDAKLFNFYKNVPNERCCIIEKI